MVSRHNLESSQTHEVSVYNVYVTNQFQGGVHPLVEVTVNSKEKNSEDFCPNYVQEFGLWIGYRIHISENGMCSSL